MVLIFFEVETNCVFSGLINNIAAKYNLEPSQISVTAVEPNGMTSFQIMPYYLENADEFQTKMDNIDTDVCVQNEEIESRNFFVDF